MTAVIPDFVGTSGAQFFFSRTLSGKKRVVKSGAAAGGSVAERVIEQGQWLLDHAAPFLPKVHHISEAQSCYEMERLQQPPWVLMSDRHLAKEMLEVLRLVWSEPITHADVGPDWEAHYDYVCKRAWEYASEIATPLLKWLDLLDVHRLPRTEVHGDPTFDNVMMRGCELVLIDPIPATAHLPGTPALDVAKILQSALGYECIKYGRRTPEVLVDDILEWAGLTEHENAAVHYFTAVHYLRLIPYQPPELQYRFLQILRGLVH